MQWQSLLNVSITTLQGVPKKMVPRFPCIFSLITFYLCVPAQFFICHFKDMALVVILNIKEFRWVIWVLRYLQCKFGLLCVLLHTHMKNCHFGHKTQLTEEISQHSDHSTELFYIQNNHKGHIFKMTYIKLLRNT